MAATTLYPVNGFDPSSLAHSTLVIPAVSLGNVPQLAADLVVSSLQLRRVGFVGTGDTVAPFAGEGDDGLVTGGLELYGDGGNVYVLLQRAPTLKTRKDAHVELIASFVTSVKFQTTLVLASLDAINQDDAQLQTPIQAILPPGLDGNETLGRLAQLPPFSPAVAAGTAAGTAAPAPASTTYPPFLPGAGLTRRVLAALKSTPSGAIASWVVEGDNRGDAHALAGAALGVLGLDADLVEPPSWAGLFGSNEGWSGGSGLDAEIYG